MLIPNVPGDQKMSVYRFPSAFARLFMGARERARMGQGGWRMEKDAVPHRLSAFKKARKTA